MLVNAPRGLVGQLAHEDEIAIAGPLLRRRLSSMKTRWSKSRAPRARAMCSAMSGSADALTDLTDVIVPRGDRDVVRRTAGNSGRLLDKGYSGLIKRAGQDAVLTLRSVSATIFRRKPERPVGGSVDVIRRRLFEVVEPARQADIKRAMNEISGVRTRRSGRVRAGATHDPRAALRGELDESACSEFAKANKYEESIAVAFGHDGGEDRHPRRLIAGDVTIRS